ncbi:GntR family transcriptional regulator [Aquibacillus koreensis]|uniref:GntR family transcriptional regulator n=1 Tax=Aquibacillus koreensis TaxID=279446 RepID=A0A9X4AJA2_9BACI|nr:GntR family transcriptional regulator [Aquibacillus koreensis]MCT2535587.1 GntR family transcriptional regulator [Aquibacillus koreensis]MDC3420128.1 GntR family transcriptional regulator [Aquibacillus koreensis]
MILHGDGTKPIYIQIAEWLETQILSESIKSDEKIYSQYQLADMFTINPATAAKGLNILANDSILYKKRGLGMFVASNAKTLIVSKRKSQTLKQLVADLVQEANRLDVGEEELIEMIKAESNRNKGEPE